MNCLRTVFFFVAFPVYSAGNRLTYKPYYDNREVDLYRTVCIIQKAIE